MKNDKILSITNYYDKVFTYNIVWPSLHLPTSFFQAWSYFHFTNSEFEKLVGTNHLKMYEIDQCLKFLTNLT